MVKAIDFHAHPMYDFQLAEHGVTITCGLFRKHLEQQGIIHACGSVIYEEVNGRPVEEYEWLIQKLNREAMACRDEMEGFYIPGIHVHPAFVRMSCEELEKYAAQGIRLVGELVHYMMGWKSYATPEMIEILKYAAELDMVVSIHPTTVEDMNRLATAIPNMKLVIAHLGGYNQYEGHLELMRRHENVYFDYSAHGADRDGTLRRAIDTVGKERLLFGTDFPGNGPASDIPAILFEGLSDDEQEAVFFRNAQQLLRLENI